MNTVVYDGQSNVLLDQSGQPYQICFNSGYPADFSWAESATITGAGVTPVWDGNCVTFEIAATSEGPASFTVEMDWLCGGDGPVTVDYEAIEIEGLLRTDGCGLVDKDGSSVALRGFNLQAVVPYQVSEQPFFLTTQRDEQGTVPGFWDFLLQEYTTAGFNVARILLSPQTFTNATELAALNTVYSIASQRDIYLMMTPYGQGRYGDIISRMVSQQPGGNPSLPNDDASQPAEDGDQDDYNAAAIRIEVQAMHDAIMTWASGKTRILVNLMNEPRKQSASVWLNQNKTWITNLRGKGYLGPIFIDGHNWANKLYVTEAKQLVAHDAQVTSKAGNVVFMAHQYADQTDTGLQPPFENNAPWQEFVDACDDGCAIGIGEWGPNVNPYNWGCNGEPEAAAAPYASWANTVLNGYGPAAVQINWLATSHDFNSLMETPNNVGDWSGNCTFGTSSSAPGPWTLSEWGELIKPLQVL